MNSGNYFVCSIDVGFEIQLLNENGQGIASARFQCGDRKVSIENHSVPLPVIEAAERTRGNSGQYVNRDGQLLDYCGNPLPTQ